MASLLIMGFSHSYNWRSEKESKDTYNDIQKMFLNQWDIVEVHRDDQRMGRLGGPTSRDVANVNAPMGRFIFFTLRVPSIDHLWGKSIIEQNYCKYPLDESLRNRIDATEKEKEPESFVRQGFYIDFSTLPGDVQVSLLNTGEAYLSEIEARQAIRHKVDSDLISQLFLGAIS